MTGEPQLFRDDFQSFEPKIVREVEFHSAVETPGTAEYVRIG